MIKEAQNPLAIRSQRWLADALLSLMEEKDFHSISVTEIAQKADLSRRTFYRAFDTKEDALVWHTRQLFGEFLLLLERQTDRQFPAIVTLYLEFWYRHKHFFELLKRSEMLPFMLNQYLRVFPDVFQVVKGDYPLAQNPEALAYAMAFSAGGLLSVLLKWADDGMDKTPQEIAHLVDIMLQPPQKAGSCEIGVKA